jgi:Rne/Rng family ribonuclease
MMLCFLLKDEALTDVRHFLKSHRPDLLPHVKKHKGSLLKEFDLEDFWDSLLEDRVELPNGGNIVIEVTTACIVIDVNQGESSSSNHKETNEKAIPVIVQHLKARHLGGNIVIDFMGDERSPQDRTKLKDLLLTQAAIYNLPLDVFGWSKLGWMEARLPKRRLPLFSILNL